jgi:hypothetical protein
MYGLKSSLLPYCSIHPTHALRHVAAINSMHHDDMSASWPLRFVRGGGPRYRQIADFIEGAVAANRMQPGDRLPPQRRLAQHLGVDLTTVTRAYAEAGERGLI